MRSAVQTLAMTIASVSPDVGTARVARGSLLEEAVRLLRLDPVRLPLDVLHHLIVPGLGEHGLEVRRVALLGVDGLTVHRVHLVGVHPDLAIERELRDLEPALALRDEHVEALDQLDDLLAIQLARVLVQLRLVRLLRVLALVVAPFQPPHVGPMRRGGIVVPEQVERGRDPLVEKPLDRLGRHLAGLHDAQQPVVPRAEMEGLFLEHRAHGARQRIERGHRQHLQLELPVPVDELGVGEEVEPRGDDLIEGAEQPLTLVGAALQQLRGLALPFVAEVRAQEVGHLPPVAHLLRHHPHEGEQVVVGGRMTQQAPLLLHGCELGVALVDDQVEQRVADTLIRDVHHAGPLALAPVVPELDVRHLRVPELGLELKVTELTLGQADRVLPVAEVVDPVVEVVQLADHQWLLWARDAPMRRCASGVANSSICCASSRSSIADNERCSLRYSASLARRTASGGWLAHSRASARASACSRSCGTTRSNSPSASASAAGTMRALHTSSSAVDGPTSRGRKKLPPQSGTSPSLWNTCPMDA